MIIKDARRSRLLGFGIALGSLLMFSIVALTSCEDPITAIVTEDVRIASLPDRVLTIQAPSDGSVSPAAGIYRIKDGEPFDLSATANSGFSFLFWEKIAGTGTAVFADETASTTTIRLSGGDATIRPRVDDTSYTITMSHSTGGTVDHSSLDLNKGEESISVTATADAEYTFSGWTVTAGLPAGIVFNPNASTASIKITANSGDATVQANFSLKTYTLTITNDGNGYTSPSGNQTVTSGSPKSITATAYPTYRFNGWTKTSGGTVTFADPSSASTTVTVTGGAATIRANFTKETVTLVERGSYQYGDSSTAPNDALDAYLYGGYLYLVGEGTTGNGVVRRWNVSTPTAPVSGSNDYFYLTGIARTIIGNGTQLFIGTDSRLYRVDITGFGPSPVTSNITQSITDLSLDSSSAFYGIRSGATITGYYSSLSSGNMITDASGWGFNYVLSVPGGVVSVQEDSGANRLAAYYALIGDTQGVTSPDSSIELDRGADYDPGWAGKPVQDVDREYVIVPTEDEYQVSRVRFYDVTALDGISDVGSAIVSKKPNRLAVDTSGNNDYYVFAAAGSDAATVYVIDMWNKSSPVVRTTLTISGFNSADAIAVNGNYLYVVVDDPTSGTNFKPTVKVYEIVKN